MPPNISNTEMLLAEGSYKKEERSTIIFFLLCFIISLQRASLDLLVLALLLLLLLRAVDGELTVHGYVDLFNLRFIASSHQHAERHGAWCTSGLSFAFLAALLRAVLLVLLLMADR